MKDSGHEERSKLAVELAENESVVRETRSALCKLLRKSSKKIDELISSFDEKVALGAIKTLYQATGVMTEHHVHTGPNGGPVGVIVLPAEEIENA